MKRTEWTFNVAVDFFRSTKAVMAGRDGRDLFLASLAWSTEEETDGFVPAEALTALAGLAGITLPAAKKAAARLVAVVHWETVVGGWLIHDYEDWQYTAAERAKQRRRNAERQDKHRRSNALPNASDNDERNEHSNPVINGVYSPQSKHTSFVNGSVVVSGGSGGTDDDDQRLELALDQVGRRRHQRAVDAGEVRKDAVLHLERCLANARNERSEIGRAWLAEHPEGAVAELVEALDPRPPTAVVEPVAFPTCPHCGKDHTGQCDFDPNYTPAWRAESEPS